jgi:iron complex transport system permease protein
MTDERTAPRLRVLKTCPLCGAEFGCAEGAAGCWCESMMLAPPALAKIRDYTEACLCPRCLSGFADRDSGQTAPTIERANTETEQTPGEAGSLVRARRISRAWWIGSGVLLLGSMILAIGIGPVTIHPVALIQSALSHIPFLHVRSHLDPVQSAVLWQVRAPRVVMAAVVGGMLAIAGSAYQGVFRNPLADPYLLGVAAGAGLGATLVIAYRATGSDAGQLVPLAAFVGASAGVAMAYILGRTVGGARNTGALILAGVTVAAFMTAAQTFVQEQRAQTLRSVYAWLLGGFGAADWHHVVLILPYIVGSAVVLLLHRRVLDVLSLGDEEAASLGLHVARVRLVIVIAATIGTAAAVAVSGLIGFVGIIVPHTIRLLTSRSYRTVVPLSLIAGAAFLVLTDVIARSVLSPSELPVGAVTAFIGAPFFAVLLRTSRRVGP